MLTKDELFVVITTEDNLWNVHGVIGTEKDAREYAKVLNGSVLPLTSLKDLRENKGSQDESLTVGSHQEELQPDELQFMDDDSHTITILKCVGLGYSIREIASKIDKSIGTVQIYLRDLEEKEFVENKKGPDGKRLARSRYLTEKGKMLLV